MHDAQNKLDNEMITFKWNCCRSIHVSAGTEPPLLTRVHTLNNCEFPDRNYSDSEVSGGQLKIPQKQSLNEFSSPGRVGKDLDMK